MQDIKALKAENIFVVLSLIMGLFYLVINPPFQAPDEAQHMFKMWGYTQGTLRFKVLQNYTGDVLPLSLIKLSRYEFMRGDTNKKITVNEIKQSLNVKLDKENKAFYTFNPTSYTPVSYFPSFLLLWVMKLLNIPPLVMMYMLRLCSLFLYTGLMYYAIKIMPVKKWLFFTLALLPMPLYTAASVSTDALFTGIVFIFIAYCSRLALRPRKGRVLRRKHYLVIGVLSLLISICKFAYMPLVLLYFIIPKDRFSSQRHRYGAFFAILLINLLVTGMFLDYSINAAKGLNTGTQGYEAGFMISFIMQRFDWFVGFICKTLSVKTHEYIAGFIGKLGWYDTVLPSYVLKSFLAVILLSAVFKTKGEERVFNLKSKLIFALIFVCCFFIIMCSAFILFQCHPVICGVQGRYFMPVAPLLLLMFDNKKLVATKLPLFLAAVIPLLSIGALAALITRFYG